jgi:calcineurin-like phosphoesterase family protein
MSEKHLNRSTWLLTDLHFSHEKMIELCNRPKDFEARIVKHWKRLIKPDDTLLMLGDISIGDDANVHQLIGNLPGRKILIKGNHDRRSDSWYEEHGWHLCCERLLLERFGRRILLSHKPPADGDYYDLAIFGHQHNLSPKGYTPDYKRFLLSLEHENYEPVLLQAFVHRCEKIIKKAA